MGCKRPLTLGENILKQGINILSGSGIESYVKQKRDEALPLGESMTPEAQPIAFGVVGNSLNSKQKVIDELNKIK